MRQIQIGTFHRICIELLRKQGIRFTIADTMLTRELAEQTIRELHLKTSASEFLQVCSLWKLGKIQETGDSVPDTAFFYYQNLLKEKGAMDFDDILIETVKLLEEEKVSGYQSNPVQTHTALESVWQGIVCHWRPGSVYLWIPWF